MKQILFDRHARKRIKERGAGDMEVESVIRDPELLLPSVKDRMNAFRWLNGRYLRVTFKEETDAILVITVAVRKRPFVGDNRHEN
jgi:hypothetical protein